MIYELVYDMNRAFDAGAYLSALSTALIVSDMCSEAEYGSYMESKERYAKWFDEYIWQYSEDQKKSNSYLSGDVMYQLKCYLLHEDIPYIDEDSIKSGAGRMDRVTIGISKEVENYSFIKIYCERYNSYVSSIVNLKNLLSKISLVALKYCGDNNESPLIKFKMYEIDYAIREIEECDMTQEESDKKAL